MIRKHLIFTLLLTTLICSSILMCRTEAAEQAPTSQGSTIKLKLLPPSNWDEWRPEKEKVTCFKAKLVGDLSDLSDTTYVFTLADVSDYTGFCMNAGTQPGDKKDIYFRQSDQPTDDPNLTYTVYTMDPNTNNRVAASEGGILEVTCTSFASSIKFKVFVDDYGAHGILSATASIREERDSQTTDSSPWDSIAIPLDDNGNDIADGWRNDSSVIIGGRSGYDPWGDAEAGPGDNTNHGDGLTAFEEYRGFWIGGADGGHVDTEPLTEKDLFVFSEFTEGYGYASNLPGVFTTHPIDKGNMASNTRRINRYTCGDGKRYKLPRDSDGRNPQSAVHVVDASANDEIKDTNQGDLGTVFPTVTVPYLALYCRVYEHRIEAELRWIDKHPDLSNFFERYYTELLKGVIGHEIGHCIGLDDVDHDKHIELFGVQHGRTIMQAEVAANTHPDGTDFTENEKRMEHANVVLTLKLAGYPYPNEHNQEYNLVADADRDQNFPAHPMRKEKPEWIPSGNGDSCDQQIQNPDSQSAQATQPDTPTGVSTSSGNGQVRLSWTAGGGTVTDYEYRYRESGGSWVDWISALLSNPDVLSDTEVLILSLINGTTYEFQVRAVNGQQSSAASNKITATPATVPNAPTALSGERKNRKVTLSWTTPSSNGGSTITDYQYRYSRTGQTYGAWTSAGGTNNSETISGLTNGRQYKFQVRAVNSNGEGPASNTAYATPATVPGVPRNLTLTAGDGQVTLTWEVPSSNGGSAITGYKYGYRQGTSGYFGAWTEAGNVLTVTVSGLTNDTLYQFRVRATNGVGDGTSWAGPESATPEMPITVPGPPRNLRGTPGNRQVTLRWDAPSSNGGATITNYEYCRDTYNDGTWTYWSSTGNGASTSVTLTGLTGGTVYAFKVRAVNSAGSGAESDSVTVTPQFALGSPGSPQNLVATAGDGQVTLSWDAPSLNGGGAISDYEYCRDTYNDGTWTYWSSTGNGSSTSVTLTGLTNGTVYAFKVRAVNSSGSGPESSKVTATPQAPTVPGAPTNLSASTHSTIVGAVYLSWNAPSDDGGTAITGYEARFRRYYSSGWSAWTSWFSTVGTYTFVTVTERTGGELYGFQVRAVNSEGESDASNTATATAR